MNSLGRGHSSVSEEQDSRHRERLEGGEAGGGRGVVTISLSLETLTSLTHPSPGGGRGTLTIAATKHYTTHAL